MTESYNSLPALANQVSSFALADPLNCKHENKIEDKEGGDSDLMDQLIRAAQL